MILEVGAVVCGFLVQSVTPVPDVGGQLWRMVYEKNGAELVWLDRPDDVKTFAIAFQTLPEDDTGVAHILEHAVLQGSEKYPVKCPFAELRKSSLNVFLNAMTGLDQTCYPFSTRNDRDFLNLADVYLDAVFHPTAVKSPRAFRQEGWHCEIDPKTGAPYYNGVVYNEMKGVHADPERVANREVLAYLFPDTVYGHNSGGKPSEIPDLTYEAFCAFHRKHYHPSRARIFLDGRVDLAAVLGKLDAVLSAFAPAEKAPPIPLQKPVARTATIPYPAANGGRGTILADGWVVGFGRDLIRQAAFEVLTDYLAGSNEAPFKKALLAKGLCDDLYLYCGGYQQMPLVLVVRGTSPEKAAACRATLRETVGALLKDGIDHARLRALINKHEFSVREMDGSNPRGLSFGLAALGSWRYTSDPAAAFDVTGTFAQLRAGVESGLFETCLREAFVNNPHHVELTYVPSATCKAPEPKPITGDIETLKREAEELADFQKRPDSEAAKATIPTLRIADIPKSGQIVAHTIATNGPITVVTTKPTTDGIAYASAYFPADALDAEDLALLPLLADLLGRLPTAQHDALALQTEVADKVGRLDFATAATERGNFLVAEFAVLTNRGEEAVALMREVLLQTRFDDPAAIDRVIRQRRLAAEREVSSRGDHLAMSYAARGFSGLQTSRDILHGYTQLRTLQRTKADDALSRRLAALAKKTVVRDGMVLSFTDNLPDAVRTALCDFPSASNLQPLTSNLQPLTSNPLSGLRIDGDAGFSGTAAALPDDVPYHGSMRVASNILSLGYLFRQIREKGGAYGTSLGIHSDGLTVCFTYRDPTPVASLPVIRRAGDELSAFARSEEPLERHIVATIAGMDPYRSPSAEAQRPVEIYLAKRTPADIAREREEVLATSRDDLERVAEVLRRQMKTARSFVVGGEKQVAPLSPDRVEPLRKE